MIGRFSNLAMTYEKATAEYLDKAPAIAKLQLIAGEETIKAVVGAMSELSASLLRLTGRRIRLDVQRGKLALLKDQMSEFGKERDRWLEEMKQYNLNGVADNRRWETVKNNFKFEEGRFAESLKSLIEMERRLFTQQIDFGKECVSETLQLTQFLVPALTAMRKELGIPTDITTLMIIFDDMKDKQRTALGSLFSEAADVHKDAV
jgi:hypothetical protein